MDRSREHIQDIDTRVRIGNSTIPFPVMVASGTFGYGEEYKDICDYRRLGGLVCKTLTKLPRKGNPPPRLQETEAGSLNSIGLANEGLAYFIESIYPKIASYPCPYIVNIAGESKHEFLELIVELERLDEKASIWGWELNLSCPNVSHGTNFGKDPKQIEEIVSHLRAHTKKPILVKLPPNVSDIAILGLAAQDGGADAISACNTFVGMWMDLDKAEPHFKRETAGYSGLGVFPITLALVYELSKKVSIPIIAIGGICHGNHAIQYLLAGASAVQLGTINFKNPQAANECLVEILDYCKKKNLDSVSEIRYSHTQHAHN